MYFNFHYLGRKSRNDSFLHNTMSIFVIENMIVIKRNAFKRTYQTISRTNIIRRYCVMFDRVTQFAEITFRKPLQARIESLFRL